MRYSLSLVVSALALAVSTPAFANEISPYTPTAGSGDIEVSFTKQTADEFNADETRLQLPVDLELATYAINGSYGVTDRLAIDVSIGYANSDFTVDPGLAPQGGLDGVTDVTIGARYKVLDEVEGAPFTATIGAAAIIDGGYTTGAITAIGDGGSGGQIGLAFGKQLGPVSYSSNIGYRFRSNNIPDEIFGGSRLTLSFADRFSVFGGVSFVESTSGINVGGPGFTPARFPELEEDYKLWNVGGAVSFTDNLSLNATYGQKFDGRNTALSNFFRVGVGLSF
jgi:hypothetical protein